MLVDDLRALVKGEVYDDAAARDAVSTDASLFKVTPEVVVAPRDADDVRTIVNYVRDHRAMGAPIHLTARAAGTCMSGGSLNDSITLTFTPHCNAVVAQSPDTVTVQPGLLFRDLEPVLAERGRIFPTYPASKHLCALGGMIANNAGGEKSLVYGKTARWVRSLRVVFADGNEYVVHPLTVEALAEKRQLDTFEGEVYHSMYDLLETHRTVIERARPLVSKNSAGYALWDVWDGTTFDLTKLFVGSQGTLGIVTEATLGTIVPKRHSTLVVLFLHDLTTLSALTLGLLRFAPESIESFDRATFNLAVRYFPSIIRQLKGNALILGLRFLPEFVRVLTGGVPELVVLVELTDDDAAALSRRVTDLTEFLRTQNVTHRIAGSGGEAGKYWEIRRQSFDLLRKKIRGRRTAPFIDDIVVRPEQLSEFLPRLHALLAPHTRYLSYTIAGHVGDGNFHIIPLINLGDPDARAAMYQLLDEVMHLVIEFHGSITGEHNDGLIRTHYLRAMYGTTVYRLFEETKRIFDPRGIFNPRKKVHPDFEFAREHVRL